MLHRPSLGGASGIAGFLVLLLLMSPVHPAFRPHRVETFLAVEARDRVVRNSEGTIVERRDGRLLMIYQEFEKGEGDSDFFPGRLVAQISADGGRTWAGRRVVAEPGPQDINVYSPSLLRRKDGALVFCFMRYHRREGGGNPPASAYAWVSHDDGDTFAPLSTLWQNSTSTLCSATLRQLSSGRLLIPVCRDSSRPGERDHWQSGVCWSDDDGRTWTLGDQWVDAGMRGAMEPHVEESRDGRLMMVVRTQLGAIYRAESRDSGRTWSPATSLGLEAPESCPELIRIPATGDLLLIWNAARYDAKWASHFGKRTPLSVAISCDEGRTWSAPRPIETDPGAAFTNPGAAFTRSGSVVLNYWTCRYEPSGRMANYPIHLKTAVFPVAWLYQENVPEYPEHQDLTYRLDSTGARHPIRTPADWEARREHIRAHFRSAAGALPGPAQRVPLDVRIEEEVRVGRLLRRKLTYQSEPGDRVSAYLFLPAARKKRPAVLCLHQTVQIGKGEPAGLGGSPNLHYARHLAEQGFVTLAPDYPSFGDHPWNFTPAHGYASGTMKGVWDHIRAVDLLVGLPEVHSDRIGVIGHSLGGHNALFLALFEPRVQAIVSSCGFTRFHRDDVPSWTGPRYLPRLATLFGNDADRIPFDFTEIVAALAPRPFLACAATRDDDFDVTGVRETLAAARPVYALYGAEKHLAGYYPDSPHDFPADAREQAYRFLRRHLKR